MAGLISNRFRYWNAAGFKARFANPGSDNIYFFIGKVENWTDESTPPARYDSVDDIHYNPYESMLGMKKVANTGVSFSCPRYDWTTATAYRQYEHTDKFLYSNTTPFYVLTDDNNVYKCIWNNLGATSTVKPTGTSTLLLRTADSYIWKFMYVLTPTEITQFLTNSYIPVKTLTANNGSAQWNVQYAASNGAIHVMKVSSTGSGYLQSNGTLISASNTTVVNLATSASGVNDIYNDSDIFLTGGTGAGQIKRIIDYNGSLKRLTVNSAFSTLPNSTTTYRIAPRVSILGDGSSAKAICTLNNNGSFANVTIINTGSGYTKASVVVSANTLYGSGAEITPIISPPGGHGSNPVEELGGYNVSLYTKLSAAESGTLTTSNDFRVIGLIKGPRLTSGAYANGTNYDTTTHLNITANTGIFRADDFITGLSSGAVGLVVDSNTSVIRVTSSNGTFSVSETISASNTSATAVVSGVTASGIEKFSGEVLYIENRVKVLRSLSQAEEAKLVIKF